MHFSNGPFSLPAVKCQVKHFKVNIIQMKSIFRNNVIIIILFTVMYKNTNITSITECSIMIDSACLL
jgi:hypothetical protein